VVNGPHFDTTCDLALVSPGVYERDIDQTWFGWEGQFGGYVLAMALEACRHHVANPNHSERMLSMQFLRRFPEGRFRAEVTTEREGRTVTNVTFRLFVDNKLCGVGQALFGSVRPSETFSLAEPPELTLPDPGEAPQPSPIPVKATERFRYWPRDAGGTGSMNSGQEHTEVGGWMALSEPGGADERFLMSVADAYAPVFLLRSTKPAIGGTIDFTAHFRQSPPASVVRGDEPVRVVLRSSLMLDGYVDEDAEVWSAAGDLLLTSRQMRYSQLIDAEEAAKLRPTT
jgi:acyl-CoA thioesterase